MITDRDLAKLPKWAASEIIHLRRQVESLKDAVDKSVDNPAVFQFNISAKNFRIPVGTRADSYIFVTESGVELSVRLDGEGVRLNAMSPHHVGHIYIRPDASNAAWFGEVLP